MKFSNNKHNDTYNSTFTILIYHICIGLAMDKIVNVW